MTDIEFQVDPKRTSLPETGIFIRAKGASGTWTAVDLSHLNVESAAAWLEREEGLASRTLLILLTHPREAIDAALAKIGVAKREADLKDLLRSAIVDLIEPMLISHLSAGTEWRRFADEFVKKCVPIAFKRGETVFGTTGPQKSEPPRRNSGLSFPEGTLAALFAARRNLVWASLQRDLAPHEIEAQRLIEKAIDWCTTVEAFGPPAAGETKP